MRRAPCGQAERAEGGTSGTLVTEILGAPQRETVKEEQIKCVLAPRRGRNPRHGTAVSTSQKTQACPKARQNRSRHRYADPRTATLHARAKMRPKRPFLLDRARPVFFSARPKRKWGVHWDKPATRLNSAPNGTHPAGGRLPPLRHHRADRINTLCGSAVPTAACCSPECGHSRPPRRSP